MSSEHIDALVKRYLQMKGYEDVVKLLESKEVINLTTNDGNLPPSADTNPPIREDEIFKLCEDIVLGIVHDPNENYLTETYDTFRSWCIHSLDFVKAELLLLCFPVFTYRFVFVHDFALCVFILLS